MVLSRDELNSLQAECMADDIDIDEARMRHWTPDDVRTFFESGGHVEPARPVAVAAEGSREESESWVEAQPARPAAEAFETVGEGADEWTEEVSIGGVTLTVGKDIASPDLVPRLRDTGCGTLIELETQASLAALRWLMTQLAVRQDMMIHTDPGPRARWLTQKLCALLRREVSTLAACRCARVNRLDLA